MGDVQRVAALPLASSVMMATLRDVARAWRVSVERVRETPTSFLGFGVRDRDRVVLKIVKQRNDEWHAGAVAAAFGGCGTVRVHEHAPGAVLLEHVLPGTPLVTVVEAGRDDEATGILAGVIGAMMVASPDTSAYATAEDRAAGFDRHLASGDGRIPAAFVEEARDRYLDLCRTQASVRLLHGDLQHYNILFDGERGWVAIDPKGVVAEAEFELAAALRNPHDMPELYGARALERRVDRVVDALRLDGGRILAWTFAQAVLSAIWTIEDEGALNPAAPAMHVARAAHLLLR